MITVDEVLKSHRLWKERFYIAMSKRERLNVAEISADNCCEFGKWLHGTAKTRIGHLAGYAQCVDRHATFHEEAGRIAQDINAGLFLEANRKITAVQGPYAIASGDLNVSVVALFKEYEASP